MSRIQLSYIRLECEYRKPMSLLYKLYYMNLVFTEKTISTLSSSSTSHLHLLSSVTTRMSRLMVATQQVKGKT
jgi:hypothetical protein